MNNRNPNIQNTYPNLSAWCDKYHKDSGVKIHPSSVPYDLVLEDVMGSFTFLAKEYICLVGVFQKHTETTDSLVEHVNKLQSELIEISKSLLEATTLINTILDTKENKKVKK